MSPANDTDRRETGEEEGGRGRRKGGQENGRTAGGSREDWRVTEGGRESGEGGTRTGTAGLTTRLERDENAGRDSATMGTSVAESTQQKMRLQLRLQLESEKQL